jgi:nucleoid-associated protein YgaU
MQVTIKKGDTLSGIAQRFLGSTDRWRQIWRDNRAVIEEAQRRFNSHVIGPDRIYPDMVLEVRG